MTYLLFALVIIAFLDNFVQLPIISPFAHSLDASPFMIGLAIGIYSFTNLLGNMLAGMWIDRYRAKPILLTGMIATAAVTLLYLQVDTPTQLVMVRTFHGFTSGLLAPSIFTLVSRRRHKLKQGRNMAHSGAAVGLAAVIGPALSGILKARYGLDSVFITIASLMTLAACLAWFRVTEGTPATTKALESAEIPLTTGTSQTVEASQPSGTSQAMEASQASGTSQLPKTSRLLRTPQTEVPLPFQDSRWGMLFSNRFVVQAYLSAFSLMFTLGTLTYVLPLKAHALALTEQSTGMLFSTFGIVAILFFILPTNRIFERYASRSTMLTGMTVISITVFTLSLMHHAAMVYFMMAVYGVGFAFLFPSMNAMLVAHVPETARGKAFGIFYGFFSIGVVAGSMTIGLIAPAPDGGLQIAAVFMTLALLVIWKGNIYRKVT